MQLQPRSNKKKINKIIWTYWKYEEQLEKFNMPSKQSSNTYKRKWKIHYWCKIDFCTHTNKRGIDLAIKGKTKSFKGLNIYLTE